MPTRRLDARVAVTTKPLPTDQTVAGSPAAGNVPLAAGAGWEAGVWVHTVGASTDVEVDEAFVVLEGRATIATEGEGSIDVGPGDAVLLEAGARTTWTVHEPLRKFYVTVPPTG